MSACGVRLALLKVKVDPDSHGSHSGIEDGHKGLEPVHAAFEPSEFCCHFPAHCRAGIKVEGNSVKRKSAKLPPSIGNFAVRNALRSKGIAE
jgi:hypothetical protein